MRTSPEYRLSLRSFAGRPIRHMYVSSVFELATGSVLDKYMGKSSPEARGSVFRDCDSNRLGALVPPWAEPPNSA